MYILVAKLRSYSIPVTAVRDVRIQAANSSLVHHYLNAEVEDGPTKCHTQ